MIVSLSRYYEVVFSVPLDWWPFNLFFSLFSLQVTGELGAVQDALLQITDRLKNHLFRQRLPAMNHAGRPTFFDQMPPFGTYIGRREPSPPRMFPNLPPFQNDLVGRPHEERAAFAHAIHGPGAPHGLERMPPTPWGPQVSGYFFFCF